MRLGIQHGALDNVIQYFDNKLKYLLDGNQVVCFSFWFPLILQNWVSFGNHNIETLRQRLDLADIDIER